VSETPDWCQNADDPIAVALWKSKRPALLEVRCGNRRHRLAKVFASPAGGKVLCLPGYKFKARDIELGEVDHGDDDDYLPAALVDIAILSPAGDTWWGRCPCGTWKISSDRVHDALARKPPRVGPRQLVAQYMRTRGAADRGG
jgi:hypothetical protein